MHWFWPALVAAIAQAALPVVSERLPVPAATLLWWMRLVAILVLLPFALAVPAPTDPLFYALVLVGAGIFAWSDMVRLGVAADRGAGIVTRLDPLAVGITFVVWTALNPALLLGYAGEPLKAAAIVIALGLSIASALRLKHCSVSRDALARLMPQLVMAAIAIVIGKYAMNRADAAGGPIYYALIQSLAVWLFYGLLGAAPRARALRPTALFARRSLIAGGLAGLFWLLHTPVKWHAIALVENPAYVTMVGLTAPLWVLGFDRLTGRRAEGDLVGGAGIILGAALLIWATA